MRPERVCYCAHVVPIETRTRVILLQHSRERRMPVGTARMAHLALPQSVLRVGVSFDKGQRGIQLSRTGDGLGREIDPDADARFQ